MSFENNMTRPKAEAAPKTEQAQKFFNEGDEFIMRLDGEDKNVRVDYKEGDGSQARYELMVKVEDSKTGEESWEVLGFDGGNENNINGRFFSQQELAENYVKPIKLEAEDRSSEQAIKQPTSQEALTRADIKAALAQGEADKRSRLAQQTREALPEIDESSEGQITEQPQEVIINEGEKLPTVLSADAAEALRHGEAKRGGFAVDVEINVAEDSNYLGGTESEINNLSQQTEKAEIKAEGIINNAYHDLDSYVTTTDDLIFWFNQYIYEAGENNILPAMSQEDVKDLNIIARRLLQEDGLEVFGFENGRAYIDPEVATSIYDKKITVANKKVEKPTVVQAEEYEQERGADTGIRLMSLDERANSEEVKDRIDAVFNILYREIKNIKDLKNCLWDYFAKRQDILENMDKEDVNAFNKVFNSITDEEILLFMFDSNRENSKRAYLNPVMVDKLNKNEVQVVRTSQEAKDRSAA